MFAQQARSQAVGNDIMSYLANPSNYKPVQDKVHNAYVCMPRIGTIIANKYSQIEGCRLLGGKQFLSVRDVAQLNISRPDFYNTLLQAAQAGVVDFVTEKEPFVLCSPTGAFEVKSPDMIAKCYEWESGGKINQSSLDRKLRGQNLPWTAVKSLVNKGVNKLIVNMTVGHMMKACFVPANITNVQIPINGKVQVLNASGINHGKGDFLFAFINVTQVIPMAVLNGEEFPYMYNNKGWTDCIVNNGISFSIRDLPVLG